MIDRILQFIEYKGISKLAFYKEVGLSNGFLDKSKSVGSENLVKILNVYPEIEPVWLLLGEGDMIKNSHPAQKNEGNKSNQNNISRVRGSISITQNELSDFIEIHKNMNEIIKTTQNQLTESQKQVNTLLEILKNK